MDTIAVLIPCCNEEQTIGKVVRDARAALPEAAVYVYDNNSTDRTAERAAEAGAVVRSEPMQGKGNVIRRMFREIDACCYIMVDGDDTYPMDSAPEMADLVLHRNADMVVGDRLSSTYFTENRRPFHNFGNSLVRSTINRLFNCDVKDIMTGFRAFSYDFVKTCPVLSQGFEIETEMTIHAVCHRMQVDNPLGFFGFFSLILLVLAAGFFIPVFLDYLATGLVARFPTLIACGFAAIAALLSFFAGLILSNQEKNERRHFELFRNLIHRTRGSLPADAAGETPGSDN